MKAPASKIGQAAAAGGILVGSAWLGSQLGAAYQTDTTKTAAAKTAGGTLGGFAAALGGLALAMKGGPWAKVGLYTAGLSVGIYAAGIATLAVSPGGPLALTTPAAPSVLPTPPATLNSAVPPATPAMTT